MRSLSVVPATRTVVVGASTSVIRIGSAHCRPAIAGTCGSNAATIMAARVTDLIITGLPSLFQISIVFRPRSFRYHS